MRGRGIRWWILLAVVGLGGASLGASAPAPRSIDSNRQWDVLPAVSDPEGRRRTLAAAARALGDWQVHLSGVAIGAADLQAIAATPAGESLVRALREHTRRAIDLDDFLLFLDDVLRDGRAGLRGELVWVTPGRGRRHGILIHPDEVFAGEPRRYGVRGRIVIDQPRPQRAHAPAADGDPPGPGWTMRFRNPEGEAEMLAALSKQRESGSFQERIADLIGQLRAQGADVYLNSTLRSPERGYLMWGAWRLSRSKGENDLRRTAASLEETNLSWGLGVPIVWWHPAGWQATREAAREMADTYDVVYATEQGARSSHHYTGHAVDLVAVGLPRRLEFVAPDGAARSFDLMEANQTRDLSLTPELIEWIEAHFQLSKLRSDYPHWDDAQR
ncbi:MAG: hypothetical protein JRG92_02550 [Deltaproteobacteria bacterium]|nr:hypothetical protein [Deltaproteobacteria bacterium]MBW2382482.1 hypothetical protein [Deltaproteobacteria bacterium]MBW2694962.1 hypothetical protein [Deltaproteobacteria bacterium]